MQARWAGRPATSTDNSRQADRCTHLGEGHPQHGDDDRGADADRDADLHAEEEDEEEGDEPQAGIQDVHLEEVDELGNVKELEHADCAGGGWGGEEREKGRG